MNLRELNLPYYWYALMINFLNLLNKQVPCGIGGPGLHKNVRFRDNIFNAGLANVTATYMNLLGFEAPHYYEPSLLTFDYNPWAFTGVHEDYRPPMDNLKAVVKK
jgi:hypothetical protein